MGTFMGGPRDRCARWAVAAWGFGGWALLSGGSAAAAAPELPVEPRFAALDAFLQNSPQFFPNGVALVIVQDGEAIFRRTYHGFDDSSPIPIASSTKWISGIGICNAIAQPGSPLSVETPIASAVPSFFFSTGPDGEPDKRGITLADGFAHLSGLPNGGVNYHWNSLITHEAAVAQISQLDLIFEPGEAIHYVGFGMHAAGLAAENALGRDWSAFMEETIFAPLGMDDTDYDAFTPPSAIPTENPNVAGSIRTTFADYERFVTMLERGGVVMDAAGAKRVVEAAALDLLLTDYAGPDAVIDRSPYLRYVEFAPGVGDFRTGFGCFIDPERLDASGRARWATSAGAYGTNAFLDRDRGIAGVLFTDNDERWPLPGERAGGERGAGRGGPGGGDIDGYNPSTRAFLEFVRPLIEQAVAVTCAGDVTRDGMVDIADLNRLLAVWGEPAVADPAADVNRDGVIDVADLNVLLGAFREACQPG